MVERILDIRNTCPGLIENPKLAIDHDPRLFNTTLDVSGSTYENPYCPVGQKGIDVDVLIDPEGVEPTKIVSSCGGCNIAEPFKTVDKITAD